MAEFDKSKRLRVKEILRRKIDRSTEVVCYAVVSGRGKDLKRHADLDEAEFAKRLVQSINAFDAVAALVFEFDAATWDSAKAKQAAGDKLLRDIRKIVRKSNPSQ